MLLRGGKYLCLILLFAGCADEPPAYCSQHTDCPSGLRCWRNTCLADTDSAVDLLDLAPALDLDFDFDTGVADLQDSSSLDKSLADMPPPDAPPPDAPPIDQPIQDLPGVGAKCSGDALCAGGYCVDGYCCDKPCSGTCEACNLSSSEGICTKVPSGKDPAGECKGSAICGADVCNGQGNCTAPEPATKVCKTRCHASSKELVEEKFCDGSGKCGAAFKARTCSPNICSGVQGICGVGCSQNSDCIPTSACDRGLAHLNGTGVCVAPQKVTVAKTWADLTTELALNKSGGSQRTHIRLVKGIYPYGLNLTKPLKVAIVGDPGAVIKPPSGKPNDPAIMVGDGVTVTLQGLELTGSGLNGFACQTPSGGGAKVTLLENKIHNNKAIGVTTNRCEMIIRRNIISMNKAGGLRLFEENFTLVNNLVADNGGVSSTIGGLEISPGSGHKVTMVNNTVINNNSLNKAYRAIRCHSMSDTLRNNLLAHVAFGTTVAMASGCSFVYSRVPGPGGGTGNFVTQPLFSPNPEYKPTITPNQCPSIDAGSPTSKTVIDILGKPRPAVKGGKVDVGAYEVK